LKVKDSFKYNHNKKWRKARGLRQFKYKLVGKLQETHFVSCMVNMKPYNHFREISGAKFSVQNMIIRNLIKAIYMSVCEYFCAINCGAPYIKVSERWVRD